MRNYAATLAGTGAARLRREALIDVADGTRSISFFGPIRTWAPISTLSVVPPVRRPLWREPRPADAPPVGRLDRLLVGMFAVAVVGEVAVRPGLAWRPLLALLGLTVAPALLWRRRHPLLATLLGWGVTGVLSLLQVTVALGAFDLWSLMAVLVLLYALARWGSGREIALGAAYVAVVAAFGMYATAAGRADVVGGSAFLLLVAALGVAVRYRAAVADRERLEIRNQERVALARELHDTVAHHVSAIAVQAQAGGVVAQRQPERAVDVLATIEAEATRTLAEMRTMVRVLRDGEDVGYAPLPGAADLTALARTDSTPIIEVTIDGPVSALPRPVDNAIYRLAQESVTNALRHAWDPTRVAIDVRRKGATVRLRVTDDGRTRAGATPRAGFGLRGMAERAQLLGGTLTAGPAPDGGWVVEAVLPVEVPS